MNLNEGLDIDGLDNGGLDIDGLDTAGLDIVGLVNDGRICGQLTEQDLLNSVFKKIFTPFLFSIHALFVLCCYSFRASVCCFLHFVMCYTSTLMQEN